MSKYEAIPASESPIKAILLDNGGVLNRGDDKELIRRKLKVGQTVFSAAWKKHYTEEYSIGKTTNTEMLRRIHETTGSTVNIPSEEKFLSYLSKKLDKKKKVLKLAKRLVKAGYVVGIISNTSPEWDVSSKAGNYYKWFNPIILSREVGLAKPNPEIYKYASKRLQEEYGIMPGQTLIVDDKVANTDAARHQGWAGIPFFTQSELKKDFVGAHILRRMQRKHRKR